MEGASMPGTQQLGVLPDESLFIFSIFVTFLAKLWSKANAGGDTNAHTDALDQTNRGSAGKTDSVDSVTREKRIQEERIQ